MIENAINNKLENVCHKSGQIAVAFILIFILFSLDDGFNFFFSRHFL